MIINRRAFLGIINRSSRLLLTQRRIIYFQVQAINLDPALAVIRNLIIHFIKDAFPYSITNVMMS